MNSSLAMLASRFPSATRAQLVEAAKRSDAKRTKEVLEVAAIAADVSIDSLTTLGLEPEANPELWRSFQLAYPNVDPASLVGRSAESLQGFVNGVKGKYFEVLVERFLNEDRAFGDIVLGPGQRAVLARLVNQPGWDIQILNPDGTVDELLQLKATKALSYVKKALENGFRVGTTEEVGEAAAKILETAPERNAALKDVLGTPVSNEELTSETASQIAERAESPLEDALDQLAEFGIDAVPVFSAVVILVTEGHAVLVGRSTMRNALTSGAKRLGKATVFSALGAGLTAVDAGIISVPTTLAARIAWGRWANFVARGAALEPLNQELALVRLSVYERATATAS